MESDVGYIPLVAAQHVPVRLMTLPEIFAALAAHPLSERGAGLVLQCDDGELAVMRELFEVASPFFGQLLSSTEEHVVKVVSDSIFQTFFNI
ncbi:hypothetical protein V8C86DRAFT_3118136 [Haematococcus lacustris]